VSPKAGVAISTSFTGLYSVIAIQEASASRSKRTGGGQHIEMALFDSQISALGNRTSHYLVSASRRGRWAMPYENRALRGAAG